MGMDIGAAHLQAVPFCSSSSPFCSPLSTFRFSLSLYLFFFLCEKVLSATSKMRVEKPVWGCRGLSQEQSSKIFAGGFVDVLKHAIARGDTFDLDRGLLTAVANKQWVMCWYLVRQLNVDPKLVVQSVGMLLHQELQKLIRLES